MENQHRHIAGYRELIPEEIELMNKIKAKGAELLQLHAELVGRLSTDHETKFSAAKASLGSMDFHGVPYTPSTGSTDECVEYRRFNAAEPQRWAAIAKTDIQTDIMAMVRAIAQPGGGV